MRNIFIPSFKFERKTQGLNIVLWGFVALISLFTVGALIILTTIMLIDILSIQTSFLIDTIMSIIFIDIFFIIFL